MIKWFTRNWSLKLISFILAVGLWYYAVGEEGIQVTRVVPLQLEVKNPQMSILKTSTRAIQVSFMAPRALVSEITSEDIQVVHTISSDINKAGDYSFRLESSEVKIKNPQVRIVHIEPETVQVTLDEMIVKKMEIKPQFVGDPAFGYKIKNEEMQLNPNAVLVEGPKGKLEKLNHVQTERVNLVGRTRSFRQTVTVELPPGVKVSGNEETIVDLYVPIIEEADEKQVADVIVKMIRKSGDSQKVTVEPEKISFVLRGAKKQLAKITPESIFAYVDISNFDRGDYDLPVEFFLPENVAIKGDPIKVKVSIRK